MLNRFDRPSHSSSRTNSDRWQGWSRPCNGVENPGTANEFLAGTDTSRKGAVGHDTTDGYAKQAFQLFESSPRPFPMAGHAAGPSVEHMFRQDAALRDVVTRMSASQLLQSARFVDSSVPRDQSTGWYAHPTERQRLFASMASVETARTAQRLASQSHFHTSSIPNNGIPVTTIQPNGLISPVSPLVTQYLETLRIRHQEQHMPPALALALSRSNQGTLSHEVNASMGSGRKRQGEQLEHPTSKRNASGHGMADEGPQWLTFLRSSHSDLFDPFRMPSTVSRDSAAPAVPRDGVPERLPAILCGSNDGKRVSYFQLLLRQQIEAFQATDDDVETHVRGRNKSVRLGQVGIRCRHCAHVSVAYRRKGSTYFPKSVCGLYQASQNMSATHILSGACPHLPPTVVQQFAMAKQLLHSTSGVGRSYWAESARQMGLVDTEDGIVFVRDLHLASIGSDTKREDGKAHQAGLT